MELSLEKHFTKLDSPALTPPAEVFALRGAVGVAIVHWLDFGWDVYLPGEPLVRRHGALPPEPVRAMEGLVIRVGGMLFDGRPLTHPWVSMSCGERGGPGKGRVVYRVRIGADQEVFDDARAAALRWLVAVSEYAETPAEPYVRPLNKQDFDKHDEMNPDGTVKCTVYTLRNGRGLRIAYWPSEGVYEAYDSNESLRYTGYFCAAGFDAAIDKLRQVAVHSLAAHDLPFKLDRATRRTVESPDGKRWTFASAENAQRYWLASIAGHIPPAATPEPAEPSAVPVESADGEVGKKYDGGKPDYALLPPRAVEAMVRVLTFGAKKYTQTHDLELDKLASHVYKCCSCATTTNQHPATLTVGTPPRGSASPATSLPTPKPSAPHVTPDASRSEAPCAVSATTENSKRETLRTPNDSAPTARSGLHRTPNDCAPTRESGLHGTPSALAETGAPGNSQRTGSQKMTNAESSASREGGAAYAGVRQTDLASILTTTTPQGASEAFSVGSATKGLGYSGTMQTVLSAHSRTCSVHQLDFRDLGNGRVAVTHPGRDNWRKVPDLRRRYISALLRHVFAHMRGERRDPETGENHLAHALCCAAFILELDEENATSGKA